MNLLVYGDPGVGKTYFCGSADDVPALRKVLILDVEGGTMSLELNYSNVDVVRITEFKVMQSIYDDLLRSADHGYGCVVLDSLTEIQKLSMAGIMKGASVENPDMDPDMPRMRDWGKNIEQIRKLVRAFRDLPIPTLFTALAMDDKDNRTGNVQKKPSLSGKLANEAAGFVDIVGYLYVKDINSQQIRYMLTSSAEGIVAKDRSNRLPPLIESPTMSEIYELVRGKPVD
jgi:phage nucleotide-binding protein